MKKLLLQHLILLFFLGAIASLKSQCTSTTVPFYEDLESISANNQLPACWAASDLGNACKTFTTGTSKSGLKYGAFFSGPTGLNYFYSPGITLHPGITYSAAVWKMTSKNNSTNWSFGLMLATSQSSTGLVNITSSSPATSNVYSSTSNTFNVSTSGTYYIAIEAQSLGSGTGEFLYWDDLTVTAPCNIAGNSPSITINATSTVLCSGNTGPTLTAQGADTYTWSDGSHSYTYVPNLVVSAIVSVLGTKTLTGCTSLASISLIVKPSPVVPLISNKPFMCVGDSTKIFSTPNVTVVLNTGQTGSVIVVSPTVTTTYTATITGSNSCSSKSQITITVNPLPTITVNHPNLTICSGESATLAASGLVTYTWSTPTSTLYTPTITVNPVQSFTYVVSGIDNKLCKNFNSVIVTVDACTDIFEHGILSNPTIYPNPFTDEIVVLNSSEFNSVVLMDLLGNELYRTSGTEEIKINTQDLPPGIYFLQTEKGITTKLIKEK